MDFWLSFLQLLTILWYFHHFINVPHDLQIFFTFSTWCVLSSTLTPVPYFQLPPEYLMASLSCETWWYETELDPESGVLSHCSGSIINYLLWKCHLKSLGFNLFVYKGTGKTFNSTIFKVISNFKISWFNTFLLKHTIIWNCFISPVIISFTSTASFWTLIHPLIYHF